MRHRPRTCSPSTEGTGPPPRPPIGCVDLKEDSSRARAPGAPRFMATVGNAALNLLRIHGVTNIAAERRRLNGSDCEILKRMGLSTG